MSVYSAGGKRLLDLAVAIPALVLLSPLFLVLAVAVRIGVGSGVFFRQPRAGRLGRPFDIVKFQTMTRERGADGQLLPDEQRLTPVGRWLRRSSLDELPELLNVVAGDMSLVGPRPFLATYLGRYSPEQSRRHEVRPGITGWAQVNGRNQLSWEDRFRLDVWYVDHVSLALDLAIIGRTLVAIVRASGINHEGHATMPEFRGGPPGAGAA